MSAKQDLRIWQRWDSVLTGAACVAGLVLISAAMAGITRDATLSNINSDLLFLESLYRDLFIEGRPIKGWHMPGVLALFPDLFIYFAARAATWDLAWTLYIYGMVTALAFALATAWLLESVRPGIAVNLALATAMTALLVAAVRWSQMPFPVLFWPSYHGGAVLGGMFMIALVLSDGSELLTLRQRTLILILIAALTIASDLFVLPQVVAPLIVVRFWRTGGALRWLWAFAAAGVGAVLFLGICVWLFDIDLTMNPALALLYELRRPKVAVGVLTAALVLLAVRRVRAMRWGLLAASLAAVSIIGVSTGTASTLIWKRVGAPADWPSAQLHGFVRDLPELWRRAPLLLALAALAHVWAAVLLIGRHRHRQPESKLSTTDMLAAYYLFAAPLAIAIAALGWMGVGSLRYLLPAIAMTLPVIAAALRAAAPKESAPLKVALLTVVILAGALVAWRGDLRPQAIATPYPEDVRCIDEIARGRLHDGFTDFWTAGYVTQLSRTGVALHALTVDNRLVVDPTINNPDWYRHRDGRGTPANYDFVVVVREQKPDRGVGVPMGLVIPEVQRRFGEPAERHRCETVEVWVYDRPEDVRVRDFLSTVAMPLRRQE